MILKILQFKKGIGIESQEYEDQKYGTRVEDEMELNSCYRT